MPPSVRGQDAIASSPRMVNDDNQHWFMSLEDARQKMEGWRRYYNEERPHGAIGQKSPITLLVRDGTPSPPS